MKREQESRKAFDFFKSHSDKKFSLDEISNYTGWNVATIKTYMSKKWKNFTVKIENDTYLLKRYKLSE